MVLSSVMYTCRQVVWLFLIAVQLVRAMGLGSGRWMVMTARVIIFGCIVGLYFIPHVIWYIITPTVLRRVKYRSSEKVRLQILQAVLQAPSSTTGGSGAVRTPSSLSSGTTREDEDYDEADDLSCSSNSCHNNSSRSNNVSALNALEVLSDTRASSHLNHTVVIEPGSMTVDDHHVLEYLRQSYSSHKAEAASAAAPFMGSSFTDSSTGTPQNPAPNTASSPRRGGLLSRLKSSFSRANSNKNTNNTPASAFDAANNASSFNILEMSSTAAEQEENQKKELLEWAEKKLDDDDSKIHNRATMDIFLPVPLHDLITLKTTSTNPAAQPTSSSSKKRPPSAPPAPKKFKVLIMVSGGAWIIGCYLWSALLARFFAAAGYVVFVPDYRNFPQTNMGGMVDDVGDAIAWVLKNADKYNGNIRDVTLMGHSAGAHLSMLTLLQQAQRSANAAADAAARAACDSLQRNNNGNASGASETPLVHGNSDSKDRHLVTLVTPTMNYVLDCDPLAGSANRHNHSFLGNPSFGQYPTENNVDVGLGSSTRRFDDGGDLPLSSPPSQEGSPRPYRPGTPTPWGSAAISSPNLVGSESTMNSVSTQPPPPSHHNNQQQPSSFSAFPSSLYEVMVNDASVCPKFDPRESIHQYIGVSGIYDVYGLLNYMHSRGLYKDILYKLSGFKGLNTNSKPGVSPTSPNGPSLSNAIPTTPAGVAHAKADYLKAVSPVWFLGESVASLARRWSPETSDPLLDSTRGRNKTGLNDSKSSSSTMLSSTVNMKEELERQKEALDDLHALLMFLPRSIKFVHGKCDKSAPTTESVKMANAFAEAIALDTMLQQDRAKKLQQVHNDTSSVSDGRSKPNKPHRTATLSVPPPTVELILLHNTNHTDPILEEQLCGSCTLLRVCGSKSLPPAPTSSAFSSSSSSSSTSAGVSTPLSPTTTINPNTMEPYSTKGNAFLTVTEAAPLLPAHKMPRLLRFGRLISAF